MLITYTTRKSETINSDRSKLTDKQKASPCATEKLNLVPNNGQNLIPFVSKDPKVDDRSQFLEVGVGEMAAGEVGVDKKVSAYKGYCVDRIQGNEAALFVVHDSGLQLGMGDQYLLYHALSPDKISDAAKNELIKFKPFLNFGDVYIVIMVNNPAADSLFKAYLDALHSIFTTELEKSATQVIQWDALWGDFGVILDPFSEGAADSFLSFGHLSAPKPIQNTIGGPKIVLVEEIADDNKTIPEEVGSIQGSGYGVTGKGIYQSKLGELIANPKIVDSHLVGSGLFNIRIYTSMESDYFRQPYSKYQRGNLGFILEHNDSMMQAKGLPFCLKEMPESKYDENKASLPWRNLEGTDCCRLFSDEGNVIWILFFIREKGKYVSFASFSIHEEADLSEFKWKFEPYMTQAEKEVLIILPRQANMNARLVSALASLQKNMGDLFTPHNTRVFCWITQASLNTCVSVSADAVLFGADVRFLEPEPGEMATNDPLQVHLLPHDDRAYVSNILDPEEDPRYCDTWLTDHPTLLNYLGKPCTPTKLPVKSYASQTVEIAQESSSVLGCWACNAITGNVLGDETNYVGKNLVAAKLTSNSVLCVIVQKNPFFGGIDKVFVYHGTTDEYSTLPTPHQGLFCNAPKTQEALLQYITYPQHCYMVMAVKAGKIVSALGLSRRIVTGCVDRINGVLEKQGRGKISKSRIKCFLSPDEYFTTVINVPSLCSWLDVGDCGNILSSDPKHQDRSPFFGMNFRVVESDNNPNLPQ